MAGVLRGIGVFQSRVVGRRLLKLGVASGFTASAVVMMHREKAHDLVEYKTYKEPSNDALVANVPKLRVAFRFCQLTILFLPFVTLWFICSRNETLYIWWCKMFKRMLEITGPTFVKAGQWAAMRSDIFSKEFCDILSDLHANVSPHPLRHTVKLIKENLGADIDELFSEFNPTPIGSGSIAQVYFAKLKSSGEVFVSLVSICLFLCCHKSFILLVLSTPISLVISPSASPCPIRIPISIDFCPF